MLDGVVAVLLGLAGAHPQLVGLQRAVELHAREQFRHDGEELGLPARARRPARSRRSWPSAASTAPCSARRSSAAAAASGAPRVLSARRPPRPPRPTAHPPPHLSRPAPRPRRRRRPAAAAAASRSSSTSASASAISSRRSATVASPRMPRARSSAARCDSSCSWRRRACSRTFSARSRSSSPWRAESEPSACLRDSSEAESASPASPAPASPAPPAAAPCPDESRPTPWHPCGRGSPPRSPSRARRGGCAAPLRGGGRWPATRRAGSPRARAAPAGWCPFCSAASALPRFTASPTALDFSSSRRVRRAPSRGAARSSRAARPSPPSSPPSPRPSTAAGRTRRATRAPTPCSRARRLARRRRRRRRRQRLLRPRRTGACAQISAPAPSLAPPTTADGAGAGRNAGAAAPEASASRSSRRSSSGTNAATAPMVAARRARCVVDGEFCRPALRWSTSASVTRRLRSSAASRPRRAMARRPFLGDEALLLKATDDLSTVDESSQLFVHGVAR